MKQDNEYHSVGVISTQGTRRGQALAVPVDLLGSADLHLVLGKAKVLGVLTQMYRLQLPKSWVGLEVKIRWLKD